LPSFTAADQTLPGQNISRIFGRYQHQSMQTVAECYAKYGKTIKFLVVFGNAA
jgi:hypothetical protein